MSESCARTVLTFNRLHSGAVALINTQTITGPYHFMHVLLGSDIDTAVFVDRKGVADPAVTVGLVALSSAPSL